MTGRKKTVRFDGAAVVALLEPINPIRQNFL
jgi:hypothetical protein